MRLLIAAVALTTLAACSPSPAGKAKTEPAAETKTAAAAPPRTPEDAPAGAYDLDLSHTSVNFRVKHIGLSNYTGRFTRMTGKLAYDPANPAAQSVEVVIDARSVQTNYPGTDINFDAQVQKEFLDAAAHPQITFKSTKVEPTGPRTARVTGDLTLRGVTKPVVLETTWNGGYKRGSLEPSAAHVGFSAHTTFKRSDFGSTYGVPAPGSVMGVSDEVDVTIETEFMQK